jgi:hypothetical protein
MLESLRAYGLARLHDAGELDAAVSAYLAWCVDLARQAERPVRTGEQTAWLDRLDAEHDNLRAAFTYAVTTDPSIGVELIGSLVLPWYFRGRRQEARHWADTFLDAAADTTSTTFATALAWSGFVAESSGWTGSPGGMEQELELAERRQRRALELTAVGEEAAHADVGMLLLTTLTRRAVAGLPLDTDEFWQLLQTTLDAFERLGDHYGAGIVRMIEAIHALAAGDLHHAAVATEACRSHARETGERFTTSRVDWMLGMLDDLGGDPSSAYRHIERSLLLLDELGMGQAVTAQAGLLVPLAERSGQPELAAQWRAYLEGRAPGAARDDMLTMASARNGEALRARAAGDLERARLAHLDAGRWYEEASVSAGTAFTESCLGFLAAEAGDAAAAAQHHASALEAATTAREPAALALALEGAAASLVAEDPDRAATLLGAAHGLWCRTATPTTGSHRDDVARIAQMARDSLPGSGFDDAFARGLALDEFEAIATARTPIRDPR